MKHIFLFLFLLSSCVYAEAALEIKPKAKLEKVSLQLHWKYQFEFAGFIAAKEKGFYRDAGLDVELKEYNFGVDIESEVLNGKSEYGIYNSYTLIEYLRGKPIVLVASFFKRAALVLVTAPNILSPKDLVGKKVMASTREDFDLNFKAYLGAYDVSSDDIELIEHTYSIDDFANGRVSAMTAFLSDQLYKLEQKGIKYNVLDPSDNNLYVLQEELFTSVSEAKNHPERVAAFRDASIKGWQYALTHKQELVNIIYSKYSNHISKESLASEAIGIEKLILPYTYDIGAIDKNFLNKQIKLFKKEYNVGLNKTLNDFIFKGKKSELIFDDKEQKYIQSHKTISLESIIELQDNDPVLYSIIEKVLHKITEDKLQALDNSWRMIIYKKSTDYSLIIKVLIVVSIIIFMMVYYQRKLKDFNKELERQVYEKTKALREVNESLEETVKEKVQELIKKDEILTSQSKQAVMGEMISMIAHQWRQPLNTITLQISNLQIRQMMGTKLDAEDMSKTLDSISETIIYLSDTVDDFQTYFTPNKSSEIVVIDELLEKVVNFVLPRISASGINLQIQKSPDLKADIYPNELTQVLLNILNNAVDAYKGVERVNKIIKVYVEVEDNELLIFVKDQACGIKQNNLKRLFEPYFSTKGKNGTGLGLYMSKMIIEKQFKGSINVESSEDGTTFVVRIPN